MPVRDRRGVLANPVLNTCARENSQGLARDVEMQRPHTPSQNDIPAAHHMTALHCLFGLSERELRRWPGMTAYCKYLEEQFQPLMADKYSYLWIAIGRARPHNVEGCWPWFNAVTSALRSMVDEDSSIEDIWNSLRIPHSRTDAARPSAAEQTACFIGVFSVLCWSTMVLQPKLAEGGGESSSSPSLQVHQSNSQQAQQQGLKMDTVGRPIPAVFRQFCKTMVANHWRQPIGNPRNASQASTALYLSSLNYASLKMISKVQLAWVDNLTFHLDFDPTTRQLSIFRFPSYCAIRTLKDSAMPSVCAGLLRALYSSTTAPEDKGENQVQLYQEMLMSYRLLFGQSRSARKCAVASLKALKEKSPDAYDPLLGLLCTQRCNREIRMLPASLWPVSCRSFEDVLQEESAYSSQDDFPMFGQRLAKLQEFSLRQQPSKLRDLWRDRRNPLQWYTFWAVLIFGSFSLLLALLQLIVATAQLPERIKTDRDLPPHNSVRHRVLLSSLVYRFIFGMINTTIQYLARSELYDTEKPYSAEFEIEKHRGNKKSNFILSTERVCIHAIGPLDNFDLDTHGFCVINTSTDLSVQDALTKPEAVEAAYFDEIEAILHDRFPEYSRLEGMEFVVRKRDDRFPSDEEAIVTHEQPAILAHSDYSVAGAMLQLSASFPGQEEHFKDRDFDIINVWRPLTGPNDDWPLAICDYTSIDDKHDTIVADLLHADRIGENQLLHYNKQHQWYYVEGQQPENLLVFRNCDSSGRRASQEIFTSRLSKDLLG